MRLDPDTYLSAPTQLPWLLTPYLPFIPHGVRLRRSTPPLQLRIYSNGCVGYWHDATGTIQPSLGSYPIPEFNRTFGPVTAPWYSTAVLLFTTTAPSSPAYHPAERPQHEYDAFLADLAANPPSLPLPWLERPD